MKKFFYCQNNGVIALVSEETYNNIQKHNRIYDYFYQREEEMKVEYGDRWKATNASLAVSHLMTPIFTFVPVERGYQPWFTGGADLWDALYDHIQNTGGVIMQMSFHVPFSNAAELGVHGKEAMMAELKLVTTEQQFRETFGISISELLAKAKTAV